MQKIFSTAFLLYFCVSVVFAQPDDDPRAELFAGYSVMKVNYKSEPTDPNDPGAIFFKGKQTLNGLDISPTFYLTKRLGLTGDFSGHFNKISTPLSGGNSIDIKLRVYNILGGVQYKFRNRSRVEPFARALAGVANTRFKLTYLDSVDKGSSTDLAFAVGGGVDIHLNKRVAIRVFQVDYNRIFVRDDFKLGYGSARADNVRYSFGIVIK